MPTGDLFHEQYQDMMNHPSSKAVFAKVKAKEQAKRRARLKPFNPNKVGSKTNIGHKDKDSQYRSPWPRIDQRYIELVGKRLEERIIKTLPLLESPTRDEISKFLHYAKRSPAALVSVQNYAEKVRAIPINLMRLLHAFAIINNRKLSYGRRSQLARLVMTTSSFNAGKRLS